MFSNLWVDDVQTSTLSVFLGPLSIRSGCISQFFCDIWFQKFFCESCCKYVFNTVKNVVGIWFKARQGVPASSTQYQLEVQLPLYFSIQVW
jgi:hypothetical protein